MRYKSRINPDDQHPDAVDFGDQPSFSLDSSIFGSLKNARTPQPKQEHTKNHMHRSPTDLFSREPEPINKSLGFNNDVYSFSDLFAESDSDNEVELEKSAKKRRRNQDQSVKSINQRRRVPGLRKISRQVINTVRGSEQPLTYKEVSDLVVERNYAAILEEVTPADDQQNDDSEASKNPSYGGELNEKQYRAVENYRRRIYDAWSVLRASNIIVQSDAKHYRYNCNVLEGAAALSEGGQSGRTVTVDAEKMERIERFMERFEGNSELSGINKSRKSNLDDEEQWN